MPIKSLHLQFRFLLPLLLVLALVGGLSLPVAERWTTAWFARDLHARGAVLATAVSDAVATALQDPSGRKLDLLLARTVRDQKLIATGWCSPEGELVSRTRRFPAQLTCRPLSAALGEATQYRVDGRPVHVSRHDTGPLGHMLVVQELGPAEHRSEVARRSLIALIAGLGLATALVTSVVAQLSLRRWVRATRSLLRGERPKGRGPADAPELEPVAAELHARLRDLEDDYRRSRVPGLEWDAQRLQLLLRAELHGDEVIVVSNREPYVHERMSNGSVRVLRPASGLVTAVEPIVRACSGTWIAHGSGSADRDTVDRDDRVALPPGGDDYRLRRIWLSPEQEQGYYSGFSNEGLWPLCHIAHVRPVFRDADWQHYREVNQRFADAVVAEARSEDPVILVQDYHLALLPAMVRRKLTRATILTFWHIPWPNPESFGICPWRKELLEGLLGSTILGFHTPTHCMNFLETADRYLEARIEHEHSAVSLRGEQTMVQSYPISIAWPSVETCEAWAPTDECRRRVVESLGIPAHHRLAVGVDRLDYTKGILERLHAVERLLEKHPQWRDNFTFVQIAAPTRSMLEEYQLFRQRIDALARRINQRFGGGHDIVRLLMEHHDADALTTLYRAADVCLVTSLHDGMNLVCKEFIAARDDEQGVLVLSSFAGAARDLPEALVVNPYHVEEVADAIHRGLTMPELEQRERMADLRSTVRESNVFRWAGWMLGDAARLRRRERSSLRVLRHGQRRVGVSRHQAQGAA